MFSAYLTLSPSVAGWLKKRVGTPDKTKLSAGAFTATYLCGHEYAVDRKPSTMALQYMQQNLCEDCRDKRTSAEDAHATEALEP